MLIHHAIVQPVRGEALNAQLPALVAKADAGESLPERLDGHHARHLAEQVAHLGTGRFDQAEPQVLALDDVPLVIQHMGHAVAKAVRHNQDARGQRQAGDGKERLHRLPLQVADGDAEGVGEQMGDAGALDEGGPVIGRWLGPHCFGRRKPRRPPHRAKHARRGRRGADQQRQRKGGAIHAKRQLGKPKENVIHQHQPMAQQQPATAAQDRAARNDHKGKLEIMDHDLPVGEAEGFHDGNLFPLQIQQPRQHCVDHKRRHAQEHYREPDGDCCEYPDFIRDPNVRRVIGSPISAQTAIRGQQTVQVRDDGPLRSARREREGQVVERAVQVKGGRQFLVGHPEDAVSAVVRQGGAGARFEDELRREHNARDAKWLAATVEQHRDGIAGLQVIGIRKRLTHEHFPPTARRQPPARAQEQAVKLRRSEVRQRAHHAAGRFIERGQVEGHFHRDAGLDRGHAGEFSDAVGEGVRGAL